MLIRITLIIAIIAGLAAAGLNFLQIKDKINTTITERDTFHQERDKESADKVKAQKLAKDTQTKLDKTTEELTSTKDERDKAVAEASEQSKRAETLAENLKKTEGDRDMARNQLVAWQALGIPLDEIKAKLASIKTVTEQRNAIASENKILLANNTKLQDKLKSILEEDYQPEMPVGLQGTVLVADPKYDFVVLNIGEKQGVKELGRLLVNRHGKLVAKVKIKSVQADRSIANIMPGWKLSDVMEGDQVIY